MQALVRTTDRGLYCEKGDFFIDPWGAVDRAVITHAHSDHARPGSKRYLTVHEGAPLLRHRLGPDAAIDSIAMGEGVDHNGVRLSLHPAGHILGSVQARLEHQGLVTVVSGDYKTSPDPTCAPFEPLRCHAFVTESTFGLPIYRWPSPESVAMEINAWWRENQAAGRASLLHGYSMGKAQRILALIDSSIGPIYTHGAVESVNSLYRAAGVSLPPTTQAVELPKGTDWSRSLIVAPPLSMGSAWERRFGTVATGLASGWMRIRGTRRRRAIDRGFVLSDHVDWPNLLSTIRSTGAEKVLVTHGYVAELVQWLRESNIDADPLSTPFEGEVEEPVIEESA